MHIGTSDVVACQQLIGGYTDFRFLPVNGCLGDSNFQIVTCSIQSGNLVCNGPYGSGFSVDGTQIFLGPTPGDTVIQAQVVAFP